MKFINDWKMVIVFCLTLGLAPFVPEPHIWQKYIWITTGSTPMRPLDWFDVLFHGFPFVLLIRLIVRAIWAKI